MILSITDQTLSHSPDLLDQGVLSHPSQSDIPTQRLECGISDAENQGNSLWPQQQCPVQQNWFSPGFLSCNFPLLSPALHAFFSMLPSDGETFVKSTLSVRARSYFLLGTGHAKWSASAPRRALRITGEFSLWWGHWDQLMKPFPQVCVFCAFVKYT